MIAPGCASKSGRRADEEPEDHKRLKRSSRRWISLQVKTTLKKPPEQKLTSTVAIGGFTQNVANFDSVPTRHQPDFKKALSTMYRLKQAEDEKQYAKWSQSSSSSSWQWQNKLVGVRL